MIRHTPGMYISKPKRFLKTTVIPSRRFYFLFDYLNVQTIKQAKDYKKLAWQMFIESKRIKGMFIESNSGRSCNGMKSNHNEAGQLPLFEIGRAA